MLSDLQLIFNFFVSIVGDVWTLLTTTILVFSLVILVIRLSVKLIRKVLGA